MRKGITTHLKTGDIRDLYGTSFALESVKVTLHRDVRLNVADIRVSGKEGEILNVQRWVAQTLESEGHATVEEADMVVELKQALVKENVQGDFEISTLEPYFYIRLESYTRNLEGQDADRVDSMLNTLVRKRREKIVRLADASALTPEIAKKLTVEERHFYDSLHETSSGFEKSMLGGRGDGGG